MNQGKGRWEKANTTGVRRWVGPPRPRPWLVIYRGPDSKQRSKTFSRFEDARRYRRGITAKIDEGKWTDPDRGRITLVEAIDLFMKARLDLEPATRRVYEQRAAMVRNHTIGSTRISALDRDAIAAFLNELLEKHPWPKGSTGVATIGQLRRFLHVVLEWCVKGGRIGRNPVHGIEAIKAVPRQPRVLSEEEVGRLAVAIEPRYAAMILVMAWTGLRIGEVAALRTRNLDLARSWITVDAALKEIGGLLEFGSTKTDRVRSFPIPEWLSRELERHVKGFGDREERETLLFTSPEGEPLRPSNWRRRALRRACERARIAPALKPHDLRHTAASLMAKAGYTPTEAQAVLGHGSVSMTLHYTQLYQSSLEAKARMLGAGTVSRGLAAPDESPELPEEVEKTLDLWGPREAPADVVSILRVSSHGG